MEFNDVAFAIHGVFVAMIFICQCTVYERGKQRVSVFCKFILVGIFMLLAICFILMSVQDLLSGCTSNYDKNASKFC